MAFVCADRVMRGSSTTPSILTWFDSATVTLEMFTETWLDNDWARWVVAKSMALSVDCSVFATNMRLTATPTLLWNSTLLRLVLVITVRRLQLRRQNSGAYDHARCTTPRAISEPHTSFVQKPPIYFVNPLESRNNYSAISNNTKLVH